VLRCGVDAVGRKAVDICQMGVSICLDIMLASLGETKLPIDFILLGSKIFSGNPP
jgi:hypothetical protein